MIKITISFIVIGLIVFTSMATFDYGIYSEHWGRSYALWDKGKDCLLLYLAWDLSYKKYGNLLLPLFIFMILRLVWDFISWGTGLSINNTKAVGVLFIIYIIYVTYKTITHVRN